MATCDFCETRASWQIRCNCGITCRERYTCTKHIGMGSKPVMAQCKWFDDGVRLDKLERGE